MDQSIKKSWLWWGPCRRGFHYYNKIIIIIKKPEPGTKLAFDLSSELFGCIRCFRLGVTSKNNYAVEGDHPPTHNNLSTGIKGVSHECPWVTGAPVRHTGLTHIHTRQAERESQPPVVCSGSWRNQKHWHRLFLYHHHYYYYFYYSALHLQSTYYVEHQSSLLVTKERTTKMFSNLGTTDTKTTLFYATPRLLPWVVRIGGQEAYLLKPHGLEDM